MRLGREVLWVSDLGLRGMIPGLRQRFHLVLLLNFWPPRRRQTIVGQRECSAIRF